MSADAVTLDEAIALLNARRAARPSKKPRRGGGRGGLEGPSHDEERYEETGREEDEREVRAKKSKSA